MLKFNAGQFLTREFIFRILLVLLIAVSYLYLIRPARASLSQQLARPAAESLVQQQPEKLMLAGAEGAISFTVYIINEENTDFSHEITFGFPFGFFMFIPLLVLLLTDFTNRYTILHIVLQTILGILMLILFFGGLWLHISLLHIYGFTIDYLIPGTAFLIILFPLIKDNKLLR